MSCQSRTKTKLPPLIAQIKFGPNQGRRVKLVAYRADINKWEVDRLDSPASGFFRDSELLPEGRWRFMGGREIALAPPPRLFAHGDPFRMVMADNPCSERPILIQFDGQVTTAYPCCGYFNSDSGTMVYDPVRHEGLLRIVDLRFSLTHVDYPCYRDQQGFLYVFAQDIQNWAPLPAAL